MKILPWSEPTDKQEIKLRIVRHFDCMSRIVVVDDNGNYNPNEDTIVEINDREGVLIFTKNWTKHRLPITKHGSPCMWSTKVNGPGLTSAGCED